MVMNLKTLWERLRSPNKGADTISFTKLREVCALKKSSKEQR